MENKENKKRKLIALLATLLAHGVLLICFIFFGLTHAYPPPPEMGIEVDMGGGGGGGSSAGNIAQNSPPSAPQTSNQQLLTQNTEETAALNANKTKPSTQQTVNQPVTKQPSVTPDPQPTVNQNALFPNKKGTGGSNTGGTGTGIGTGDGSGIGDGTGSGSGGGSGAGSGGGTGDFYLDGRPVINKAYPKAKNNLNGVVKIEFRADPQGNVTHAEVLMRGTTIQDPAIWEECKQAAKKSTFKAKTDAPTEQKGIITYKFIPQ
ncbi:MAG: hypothetical protein LBR36_08155 [Bacteroidales bacterium]|jgi:outer membrane biosynthesis protein TonB|nr:hypothetical protein [Bacteroidales bacterium]